MKLISIITCAVIALSLAFGLYSVNNKMNRTVVVDVIKVFNEFELKKELEGRVEGKLSEFKSKIDSLNSFLDIAKSKADEVAVQKISQMLEMANSEARQAYEISNKTINEQVWKRLNPLIDDYAKTNGLRLVLGANGMGTVLYVDPGSDKTQEVIQFVNSKYEKGN